jgi:hypothetical protein
MEQLTGIGGLAGRVVPLEEQERWSKMLME